MKRWLALRRLKAKYAWWSWQNWRKGYAWGAVQRCRTCTHTTPFHYPTCEKATP